jgi:hypothetical protein
MGDGSASADLLPDEEVDEDLADDVLDGAVTDVGASQSWSSETSVRASMRC